MYSPADVPEEYRQFFFVNTGGPSRKVMSRKVVHKKWQLVTLDCSHRILVAKYQKGAKIRCGFCGGLDPLSKKGFFPRGVEHVGETPTNAGFSQKRAARSGALDAGLQELIDAWPDLPSELRDAVVVMVRAASRR
jgi:hypothetical protein